MTEKFSGIIESIEPTKSGKGCKIKFRNAQTPFFCFGKVEVLAGEYAEMEYIVKEGNAGQKFHNIVTIKKVNEIPDNAMPKSFPIENQKPGSQLGLRYLLTEERKQYNREKALNCGTAIMGNICKEMLGTGTAIESISDKTIQIAKIFETFLNGESNVQQNSDSESPKNEN